MARSHLWLDPNTVEDDNTSNLTEQQLHIWEHAALLYHADEWQAAANAFAALSEDLRDPQLRSSCLLNTAMIMARLGDLDIAASTFKVAAEINPESLVNLFLIGNVAYEQEDYSFAGYAFDLCLEGMSSEALDYSDVGLGYVLERGKIRDNLRETRAVQFRRGVAPTAVHSVPAGLIFEAPARATTVLHGSSHSSRYEDDSLPTVRPRASCMSGVLDTPPKRLTGVTTSSIHNDSISSMTNCPPRKSFQQSWRDRPKTPYTARDEHAVPDSTRELAMYIRRGGKDNPMTPKDPKGEYSPVEELSNFVQAYAPGNHRKTPELFDLSPNFIIDTCLSVLLNDHYKTGRSTAGFAELPRAECPACYHSDQQRLPVVNEPASEADARSLAADFESSQVLTCQHLRGGARDSCHGQRNDLSSTMASPPRYDDQAPATSSGTSAAESTQLHRQQTLHALEGRGMTRSVLHQTCLPPRSLSLAEDSVVRSNSWQSTVSTVRFFEKILSGTKRR